MKRLPLLSLFLGLASIAHGQLPPRTKVISELQRIYNGGTEIFQSWKGGLAKNLGTPEYESMYTFPGTIDPRIKQAQEGKPVVYYYEATLAEGKTATEIKRLLKDWQTLFSDSTITSIGLVPLTPGTPDEKGLNTITFTVTGTAATSKGAPLPVKSFQIHLDYEQADEDELYSAFIQIGYLK